MIIGISGKMGSGKDTVGEIIKILSSFPNMSEDKVVLSLEKVWYNNKFEIKKFADKLKDIVCILIGCTRSQLEDREFKEKELGEEWWYWKGKEYDHLFAYTGQKMNESYWTLIKVTPRILLQLIGTECGRNIIHPNIWVNALMSEYKPIDRRTIQDPDDSNISLPNWIITDMRFPNELEAVKSNGGISIRVNRPSNILKSVEHISEAALDGAEFDYTIINEGTLQDLVIKVKIILKELNII